MPSHSVRRGAAATVAVALVAGLVALGPSPVAAAPDADGAATPSAPVGPVTSEVADDRLLVGVEPGTASASAARLARSANAAVEGINGNTVVLDPRGVLGAGQLRSRAHSLADESGVRYVEPNSLVRTSATVNDPRYSSQYALQGAVLGSMNAQGAWNAETGDAGVVVAVLDSGIDLGHEDLVGNLWSNPGGYGAAGQTCPAGTHGRGFASAADLCVPQDDVGLCGTPLSALQLSHGTHVSGIVGAVGNNATGISGVSQDVSLMALRMLDGCGVGTVADAVMAIDWALAAKAQGVNLRVLNASWGGADSTFVQFGSSSLYEAVVRAENAGVLVVTASGNTSANLDAAPSFPCAYPNSNIVCVGASDSTDAFASFSNSGATSVDVVAPGVGIWSTVVANTSGCLSGSAYCAFDGTSMAAPQVAGGAALVLAAQPGLTMTQLRSRLLDSVDRKEAFSGKVATGGRLNLCMAVQACTAPVANPYGELTPVTPSRIYDTRDGTGGASGALGPNVTKTVQITNRGPIPASGVAAVVMNVTATAPSAGGYLTVWPNGVSKPTISNVNFVAGQTVPNLATVAVGTGGQVNLYNLAGSTHVIFDVVGYYASSTGFQGSRFHSVTPYRYFDTRTGSGGVGVGALAQTEVQSFDVTGGASGVPASGVTAVVMNVTVTGPTVAGFLTVYPSDVARPLASNLNFVPNQTVPNLVTVRVPANGVVEFFNSAGSTHVIADVVGYYDGDESTDAGRFVGITPARAYDTRAGTPTPLGPGETWVFDIAGLGGVPAIGATSAVMNVTVTQPTLPGFVTVFPDHECSPPTSSNLNFSAGQTVPNLVISGLAVAGACTNTVGAVDIYNLQGSTHVVVDLFGYFSDATTS